MAPQNGAKISPRSDPRAVLGRLGGFRGGAGRLRSVLRTVPGRLAEPQKRWRSGGYSRKVRGWGSITRALGLIRLNIYIYIYSRIRFFETFKALYGHVKNLQSL